MDLEALQSGDSTAWSELASELRTAIGMQVRGDRSSLVEDAVQEALLALWLRIQRGPKPESVRHLAYAVARNKAMDVHRRVGLLRRWESAMEPRNLAELGSSRDDLVELRLAHERLASVGLMYFRKHHPECEELLRNRMEGLTWDELSVKIGESSVTLRQRWSRCRKHLLSHLAGASG